MNLEDIEDYGYEPRKFDFANVLHIEQKQNSNGSYDTFYNMNDGAYIDGVDGLQSDVVSEYICKNKDDLRLISYDLYGSTEYWWILAKINKIDDCLAELKTGSKIKYLPKYYLGYIYGKIRDNI